MDIPEIQQGLSTPLRSEFDLLDDRQDNDRGVEDISLPCICQSTSCHLIPPPPPLDSWCFEVVLLSTTETVAKVSGGIGQFNRYFGVQREGEFFFSICNIFATSWQLQNN